MIKKLEPGKDVTMMDLFSISTDLFIVANQNKRIIEGKAHHLMGPVREMRVHFGPESRKVPIFLPVHVGDYIFLLESVGVVPAVWKPWKKIYLNSISILLDIEADDPGLEPIKKGLEIKL